jgi:hypothetical protein
MAGRSGQLAYGRGSGLVSIIRLLEVFHDVAQVALRPGRQCGDGRQLKQAAIETQSGGDYTSAEAYLPRKARKMRTLGIAAIISGVLVAFNVSAMEYRLTGRTIYATGAVEAGDAASLSRLIRDNDLTDGFDDYVVRLNSPGGLVLEGMEVGRVIRDARLETLVVRGDICASACALAFLGGTRRYATGNGVGRRLEFGAMLGFHGFRSATDAVQVENETLSGSRVLTALILEYAAQIRGVDLGWLANTLNVPPEKLFSVRRPVDIAALSIFLEGAPILCRKTGTSMRAVSS